MDTLSRKFKNIKFINEEGIDVFPSAKIVEKKVLKDFKEKYNKLPIGCSQK